MTLWLANIHLLESYRYQYEVQDRSRWTDIPAATARTNKEHCNVNFQPNDLLLMTMKQIVSLHIIRILLVNRPDECQNIFRFWNLGYRPEVRT
jgi:hypothetical protein